MECPNCHTSEHIIKVWEDPESYDHCRPDWLGCTGCSEMSEYRAPMNDGCWICHTLTDDMAFDTSFDTYVHPDCLAYYDCKTVVDYESAK